MRWTISDVMSDRKQKLGEKLFPGLGSHIVLCRYFAHGYELKEAVRVEVVEGKPKLFIKNIEWR